MPRYQFRTEFSGYSLHRSEESTFTLSGSALSAEVCSQNKSINQTGSIQRQLVFSPIPTRSQENLCNQPFTSSSFITRSNRSPAVLIRDRINDQYSAILEPREIFSPAYRKTDRSQSSPKKLNNPFNVVSSSSVLSRSDEYSRGESTAGSVGKFKLIPSGISALIDTEKCISPRLKPTQWIAHERLPKSAELCNVQYVASENTNAVARGDAIVRTLSNDECMSPRFKK